MSRGAQVIVAGAGALGLSTALALADAGCSVTVCDPGGSSASAVAAGMLAPVFEAVLDAETSAFELLLAARDLWPALEARAGVYLERSGAMAVGGEAWLAKVQDGLTRLGAPAIELSGDMARDLAAGLSGEVARALLVREDWRLDARPALAALRAACEAAGVQFRAERATGRGESDWLVVATGADPGLADIAPELAHLSPIKGQILRYLAEQGGRVSVRAEGAYAVPGADGLAIGATMEPGVADARIDPVALTPLVKAAGRMFPGLAEATFAASAGVRAATPDGLPMVGASQAPGVILAVGARRNGWLLAPMAANIVTAVVTGGDAGAYAARLDPARFGAA